MVRGSPMFHKISNFVARSVFMTSCSSGSVAARPVATFTTMGKMHMIMAVSTAGTVPAILTAITLAFFPIVVNVATGLATTEPELEDVMKAMKATKLDILFNVGLPRTMPYFFASLKVAVTQAFVGTVIAETVASNRGIGNLMMIASSSFDVPLVFAGLLILGALGVGLYVIFSLIEDRVTGWARRNDEFALG